MTSSIDELIGQVFGNNSSNDSADSKRNPPKNYNSNGKGKKKKNESVQVEDKSKQKSKNTTYKYSNKGRGSLHEAVILAGKPTFLKYESNELKSTQCIEESGRIIKPPEEEEYPYEPYEFRDMEDLTSCYRRAKLENMDSIFNKAKYLVQNHNDQDDHKLILIASDIVWSYFQDRFGTTHYLGVVGDNGSGKSTVGDTFEALGYRPVSMTDPSAANLFRVLGTLEPGQCTIIADEAEKIDQSSDIMSILKTGYHIKKKVTKTNTNIWKQEFYWTYCFKIIIAERSPHQHNAKGVLDRTFVFNTYKGNPKYDIKEVLNPQGNQERQKLLGNLTDFRKLLLIYRLIHFKDTISDINIGLDGRDKELCKPLIQLFYNTHAQKEIETALQKLIEAKNQRKESTIEAALYPIISNLVSQRGNEVSASQLWYSITSSIEGTSDERKPNEYHTVDYGTIYRNSITNIICDKFGAKRKHKESGNILIFNPEKVVRTGKLYDRRVNIQTKLIDSEDSEDSESSVKELNNSQNDNNTENKEINYKADKNSQDFTQTSGSILKPVDNRSNSISLEPSEPSYPSAISSQESRKGTIYRLGGSDTFACKSCSQKGDIWYMKKHLCKGTKK